jgi:hypothetical protein
MKKCNPSVDIGGIQWPKDTNGVIRSCKLKDRQYNGQEKKYKQ